MNAVAERMEREPNLPALATPMQMLAQAIERGMSPETIDKLLVLAERFDRTNARKAFDMAIAKAKAEIPVIIKTATGHNEKKYADFAAIARVVDPIISKHGLSYRFRTVQTDKISVTCVLSHEAGHYEETTLAGPADQTGNKNAIQAIGSTLTYLQRYSLVQALGLAAAADDDGKGAAGAEKITQEQADNLRDLLETKGANVKAFLSWAKVERLENIRAEHYESCIAAVNNYKPKQAAS